LTGAFGDELLRGFLMLFIVLDALGNAPLFYLFTKDFEPWKRVRTIRKSIVIATLILLFFGLLGDYVLEYFDITVNDFRIAGGVILFIYAVLGILGHSEAEVVKGEEIAIVPLATPLLAGPGAITVVIYLKYSMNAVITVLSILGNMAVAWALLENGGRLLEYMGKQGSIVLSKIFAILLAAYAVSMIRVGILLAAGAG
jgi:multiple antibiotic resistance protein